MPELIQYLLYKEGGRDWFSFNFNKKDLIMELVPQNSPTTCGQACIATLLRISLEQAIKIVGHDGITSDEEITKALSNYVVLNFVEGTPTEGTALQKHRSPDGKREHWTIYDRGRILDPANHKKLWAVYKYARLD